MNPSTVDSVLLATLEQFECQSINRLLLGPLEEYEDLGTTQKEDVKKTSAKCYHQLAVNTVYVLYEFLL